jgi:serine protease Do
MRTSTVVLGSLLFLAGMAGGVVLTGRLQTQAASHLGTAASAESVPLTSEAQPSTPAPAVGLVGGPDFTLIAEATVAAVTNISSRQVVQRQTGFANDPFFRYFFGDRPGLSGYQERQSLGSGVIVRNDGYILTNAHVIGVQTAGVTVTLADNREYQAEVVGRDASTDIALLKIETENLPIVPLGDSSSLRIAEWVLAVGNPFQLNQTVTLGIVSAVGRDNLGVARYEDFIQTDAAINPGNSGGALVNSRGELVGINTAIFSESGGYQGVGFAVPSNLAKRVMEELIEFGEVRRGSFGYVDVRQMSPRLARELGVPETRGVVVWQIHQDSAAARVGIEPGDVIVAFNGQPVNDPAAYLRLLSDAPIGSTVILEIIRAGEQRSFEVAVLQARPR